MPAFLKPMIRQRLPALGSNTNTTPIVHLDCPMFCTSEIVSVAQRVQMSNPPPSGSGKVGSAFCFPLFHTHGMFQSAMLPALVACSPTRSAA